MIEETTTSKTPGERLKHIRKDILNLNQIEFAKKLALSSERAADLISKYENGKIHIPHEIIFSLSQKFKINLNWLLIGEGPIYINEEGARQKELSDYSDKDLIAEIEHRFSFRNVEEVLAPPASVPIPMIYDMEEVRAKRDSADRLPILAKTSAGTPADYTDGDYPVGIARKYVHYPQNKDPRAFALVVEGTSMSPKYLPGDILIVTPSTPVKAGDDVIYIDPDGNHKFKRLKKKDHSYILEALNPAFKETTVLEDPRVRIYPVIDKVRIPGGFKW